MKIERRCVDSCILLLSLLAIAIWASPLWLTGGMTGIYDWDTTTHRFEALRRTVLEFRQWPGHNPWTTGGVPLLGNPNLSLVSIKGVLVLVFGTFWGLRLGVMVYLFLGFIGAWKLSSIWWKDRFLRLVFGFYSIANPALTYHMTVGHLVFQTFWFMPLSFYYLLRFKEDKWSGLKAAIILGLAFSDSPSYVVQHGLLILVLVLIWLLLANCKQNSKPLSRWLALFIPILGALTFYRGVTVLQVAVDFPRIANYRTHFDWNTLYEAYLVPHTDVSLLSSGWCFTTWEICSYVGITSLLLSLLSLRQGLRWWHAILIVLIWAGIGNDSCFHIMYWIQKIPGFSSHSCFSRIRMFTLLFFGIAATEGLRYTWMRCKNHSIFAIVAMCIGVLMVGEVLLVSHTIMKSSHSKFTFQTKYTTGNAFQNISSLPNPDGAPANLLFTYEAIRMNLGWLRGYGDSYLPADSIRKGSDEPGYIAEFHQGGQAMQPTYWSPNRMLFQGLDPNTPLVVNLNPGRAWYSNGVQLFPQYRIVEPSKPFEVMPNSDGVVELTYRYPGQILGLAGTIVLLIISTVTMYLNTHVLQPESAVGQARSAGTSTSELV